MDPFLEYIDQKKINEFIRQALIEDIGPGDHSTIASIDKSTQSRATIIAKDAGIVAGLDVASQVFKLVDDTLKINLHFTDGDKIAHGDVIMDIDGHARAILMAERLALNFMQRMSGIATKTNQFVRLIEDTYAQILDTRKTTPNFRMFEKWAVKIGGGRNHRFALYDMIMLKDNHIDCANGISEAVKRSKKYLASEQLKMKIEVETRNLREVKEAIEAAVDVILLDNMNTETMRQAVKMIGNRCLSEASGGITEFNILEVAQTGVDYISIGALTHSYSCLDMSLNLKLVSVNE